VSRYRGNNELCPGCGAKYKHFRAGVDYREVSNWLWVYSDDPRDWKYKRRGTILGKLHQVKREGWEEHKRTCQPPDGLIVEIAADDRVEGVPF
jgi:hypothetical protein